MPRSQSTTSVGSSSSVALFLLLTSVCCFLSLSTTEDKIDTQHDGGGGTKKTIKIPNYIPDIAMLWVMSIGTVAMVVFIVKRRDLTVEDHESNFRHKLQGKYSLYGIAAFFIGVCILGANYIVVELSCVDRWAHCYDNRVFLVNLFELVLRIVVVAFACCETMVCWMLQGLNFKRSQLVWHGVAVVQAANVALWFDSVLNGADLSVEGDDSFDAYFTLCNQTYGNRSQSQAWCSKSSGGSQWFFTSSPFLYPITIEFVFLVSETFLRKIIGTRSHRSNENAQNETFDRFQEYSTLYEDDDSRSERTPLLRSGCENSRIPNTQGSALSSSSNIFILISGIINIAYLVIVIVMFTGNLFYTSERPSYFQTIINFFILYETLYMIYMIICCAVGFQSCRRLKRQRSNTSFLEYMFIFATYGGLFLAVKRIVAYVVNSASSDPWICVYFIFEVVDIIEILLQMVFYYYAKDVTLSSDGERANSPARVAVFQNIVVVVAIGSFVLWLSDCFVLPEMSTSIKPSNYFIEPWPVFDSVVNPVVIFFRFISALLFWCIYSART